MKKSEHVYYLISLVNYFISFVYYLISFVESYLMLPWKSGYSYTLLYYDYYLNVKVFCNFLTIVFLSLIVL